MRARLGFAVVVGLTGCAQILGIEDRYFDGGPTGDAALDTLADQSSDSPTDTQADVPQGDGGACGGCVGGICILACHQDTPVGIAVDTTTVYWVNGRILGGPNDGVYSVPIAGGQAPAVLSMEANNEPVAIGVTGGYVYYANQGQNALLRVATSGGGGALVSVVTLPTVLALTPTWLAYAGESTGGEVYACHPASNCGFTIADTQPPVFGIAVDATNVFWSTSTTDGGTIAKCAAGGNCMTSPTTIEPSENNPSLVAVDDTYVYWVVGSLSSTQLYRALKTDGTGRTPLAVGNGISGLAVDNTHVYFSALGLGPGTGSIVRIDRTGMNQTTIAGGRNNPSAIAIDGTNVYWTEWGKFLDGGLGTDGNVVRAPK